MTIFYFWYKRYLRKKREIREKEIQRDFSRSAYGFQSNEPYGSGGNYADYLNDRVREEPLLALLGAGAIGFALGLLIARR